MNKDAQTQWWEEDAERLNRMAEEAKKSGKVIEVLPKEEEKSK